ncbi:MAG: hypothetical protein HY301_18940 [Verrucomicrobia bacterium]|nr:hypothetical protein [Verrucomicrobiota bacterium]
MINPFKDVNWNPGRPERRKFAVSLIIGFPIVGALMLFAAWLKTHAWQPFGLWLGAIGCAAGVVFWLVPQIARPFYVAWYFLACCIGIVVSNVLLTVFFYLAVTPVGWLLRACGRQPLSKGFDKSAATYWRDAEKGIEASRYYRQF